MDRDEKLYFDNFNKLSLDQIRELFQNLKHIGVSDEEIKKYAEQYKIFFEKLTQEKKNIDDSKNTILIGDHAT